MFKVNVFDFEADILPTVQLEARLFLCTPDCSRLFSMPLAFYGVLNYIQFCEHKHRLQL
jgi:hypothetical protein